MADSLPFNAIKVDGEFDRVFKAEDWAWYFATFLASGVFPKPSDGLQVVAHSGMEIRVNMGYAFINGYAPCNIVMKLSKCQINRRQPMELCVKLSDVPGKEMGDPREIEVYRYLPRN